MNKTLALAALALLCALPVHAGMHLAPDGSYTGGTPHLAPDGSYVGGTPHLAPDGSYVGDGRDE